MKPAKPLIRLPRIYPSGAMLLACQMTGKTLPYHILRHAPYGTTFHLGYIYQQLIRSAK